MYTGRRTAYWKTRCNIWPWPLTYSWWPWPLVTWLLVSFSTLLFTRSSQNIHQLSDTKLDLCDLWPCDLVLCLIATNLDSSYRNTIQCIDKLTDIKVDLNDLHLWSSDLRSKYGSQWPTFRKQQNVPRCIQVPYYSIGDMAWTRFRKDGRSANLLYPLEISVRD